jgi:hypothetical protein
MKTDWLNLRVGLAIVCCVFVAVPFLVVHFPPVSDLPQHAAQVRLFLDAVQNPNSIYRVQWLTPYSLVYVVMGGAWALVGPENAGRIATLVIGVIWTVVAHLAAARRSRSVEAAILASVLFFNSSTYWGFLSFLIGWPSFLGWVILTTRPSERGFGLRDAALLVGTSLLLFFSHALWFAVGLAWLGASILLFRPPLRIAVARCACAVPVTILALVWYAEFAVKFATPTVWADPPWARLSPVWLTNAAFGGLYGPIEYAVFAGIAIWMVLGIVQNWSRIRESIDKPLLAAGLFLLTISLVLPYKYENTIQFSSRWLAPALILLLLALPTPAIAPRLVMAWAAGLLAAFCLSTALVWRSFERVELAGLATALDALPPSPSVLGLDFAKESQTIKGRPFLQSSAYAQVVRGGRLGFSFAEFPPMLVIFDKPQPHPWTVGLEWMAEQATSNDIQHFDYVLANGAPDILTYLTTRPDLEPVTTEGRFWLFRVKHPA